MKAVILAGGESSRFWPLNYQHKSLFKILGKPLIYYTIEGLKKIKEIKEILIVQGPKREIEERLKEFSYLKIKYVIQEKPEGMGDALWQVRNYLREKFLVLNPERLEVGELFKKYQKEIEKEQALIFGVRTKEPSLYGIAKIKRERILEIVEKPSPSRAPSDIKILGIYVLNPQFFEIYQKIKREHYDFEKALSLYFKKFPTKITILKDVEREFPSLKYPWHLFEIKNLIFKSFLRNKIEKSAKISKKAIIEGRVWIEKNVKIFEGATIKGPCYLGENSIIGNNTLIREGTNLEKNCLIGAFSEVKNCIFEENCHCHSGYFGDSIFSENCKIGAGTIIANARLDRKEIVVKVKNKKINSKLTRLGAIVGKNVKIGIHSSLMPGVLIGSNCLIYPCSIVKENLKNNTLLKNGNF